MKRKKIEALTSEQEEQLLVFRQKWLDIGMSVEPIDTQRFQSAVSGMYRKIDKKPPYLWVCDSPWQSMAVISLLKKGLPANLRNNLRNNLEDNLMDNLWDNLMDNLWDNLMDNLGDNLRANLWANLMDNLGDNLEDNLGDNLRDNLWANLMDNLWANLRANLGDNLRDNLEDNLGDNLRDNLEDNLGDNLRNNLRANLWANLMDNLGDNLRDNLGDNLRDNLSYQRTYLWGAWDIPWIAYYIFPHQHIRKMHSDSDMEVLNLWADIAQSGLWWWAYEGICFVSDRPRSIKNDADGRLHCENGYAMSFSDGYGLSSWHGTQIPNEWITKGVDAKTALTFENVEQRRCACEILGWHNILNELNAKTIDKHANPLIGELVSVDIPDIGCEQFLRVMCGTKREFALPVPPDIQTAMQGQSWINQWDSDADIPEIRT